MSLKVESKLPPHGNIDIEFFPSVRRVVVTIKRDDGQKFGCSMSYDEFRTWLSWANDVWSVEEKKS